jgi:hypothetical protein
MVAVAPARVELSVGGDPGRVTVQMARMAGDGTTIKDFRKIELRDGSTKLRLELGYYILRVRASSASGEASFIFTLCV